MAWNDLFLSPFNGRLYLRDRIICCLSYCTFKEVKETFQREFSHDKRLLYQAILLVKGWYEAFTTQIMTYARDHTKLEIRHPIPDCFFREFPLISRMSYIKEWVKKDPSNGFTFCLCCKHQYDIHIIKLYELL